MPVEFLIGGLAACGAGFFTNPLEVAKTRMQLQGELVARGKHAVHYRNVVHAFYTIGRVDGLLALQKGLVPALWYQFVMNGVRLGCYQRLINLGFTKNRDGRVSVVRSVAAGALSGCLGAAVGSPLYMVKTHLQSRANAAIAVGHQHEHGGMAGALQTIFLSHGIRGLWRGVSGAITRVSVGSATQLTTFSWTKEHIVMLQTSGEFVVEPVAVPWSPLTMSQKWSIVPQLWYRALSKEVMHSFFSVSAGWTHWFCADFYNIQIFSPSSWLNALAASMVSGVVVVMLMTPFDVVSTRLYNQGTDSAGRGLLYRGVADCFLRTFTAEGLWGFYKGCGASFFRLGPHTVLSLVFWNQLLAAYHRVDWTSEVKL